MELMSGLLMRRRFCYLLMGTKTHPISTGKGFSEQVLLGGELLSYFDMLLMGLANEFSSSQGFFFSLSFFLLSRSVGPFVTSCSRLGPYCVLLLPWLLHRLEKARPYTQTHPIEGR